MVLDDLVAMRGKRRELVMMDKADWTDRIHTANGKIGDAGPFDVYKARECADGNDHSVTLSACAVHMRIGDEEALEVDSFVWDESEDNYRHFGSPERISPWLHMQNQMKRRCYRSSLRSRYNRVLATVVWKGRGVVVGRLGGDLWRGSRDRFRLTTNSKGMRNLMKGKCADFQIQRTW